MYKDCIVGHRKDSEGFLFIVCQSRTSRRCGTGQRNHRNAAATFSEASYALSPASSSSLFELTWGCRGRCHRGKPSASRCPWWCRGWRSAWSGQRTYRGPKSFSPDGCRMSCSGCWCSGRTDARPSSSDAGTESWWSPVGGEKRVCGRSASVHAVKMSANHLLLLMLLYDYTIFKY